MRTFSKFLLPLSSLMLLTLVGCAQLVSPDSPRRGIASEVPDSLIRALAKQTRVITHDTYVYHWTMPLKLNLPGRPAVKAAGIERGRTIAEGFWSDDIPDYGLVGNGLYMARDPMMSMSFGSTLISLTLPIGTRLLDIRNTTSQKDNSDYQRGNIIEIGYQAQVDLQGLGCSLPSRFVVLHLFKNAKCTAIFKDAFKALRIAGNIHHWWGHNTAVCNGEATAFAIWDPELFTEQNVRTYQPQDGRELKEMKETSPEAAEEFAFIYGLALVSRKISMPDGSGEALTNLWGRGDFERLFPEIKNQSLVADWVNKHQYNCRGEYPEDVVGKLQELSDFPAAPEAAPAEILPIKVQSATYGGNLKEDTFNNALQIVKDACDTKGSCSVSSLPFGAPKGKDVGDMVIEWSCGESPKLYRNYIKASPVEERSILSCRAGFRSVPKPLARVKIKKALFDGSDVTAKAQEFCELKPYCEYMIKARYLGERNANKARDFKIDWVCTDEADQIQSAEVSAPSEGKKIMMDCSRQR